MSGFVLGVDGGGTKTDYLLFDMDGHKKAHLRGGGTNHEGMAGGMNELESRLKFVLLPFLRENGLHPCDIVASVFGMAGVDVPSQKSAVEGILTRIGLKNLRVMNDSFIGIKAGSKKGYGICAVNGTGNTIGGIDRMGRWLQVAGTGYISCEDGGAIMIAAHVLRAVYEEHFCMGSPTAMTPLVMALLGINDPVYYMESLHVKYPTGSVTYKDVLDVLFQCANADDDVAIRILRHVGGQIARCIAGCERKLDLGNEFDVVLVGSVTLKGSCPVLLDTLKSETLRLTGKQVSFIPLHVPVAVGAVLWAIEIAQDRPVNDAVEKRVITDISTAF